MLRSDCDGCSFGCNRRSDCDLEADAMLIENGFVISVEYVCSVMRKSVGKDEG